MLVDSIYMCVYTHTSFVNLQCLSPYHLLLGFFFLFFPTIRIALIFHLAASLSLSSSSSEILIVVVLQMSQRSIRAYKFLFESLWTRRAKSGPEKALRVQREPKLRSQPGLRPQGQFDSTPETRSAPKKTKEK